MRSRTGTKVHHLEPKACTKCGDVARHSIIGKIVDYDHAGNVQDEKPQLTYFCQACYSRFLQEHLSSGPLRDWLEENTFYRDGKIMRKVIYYASTQEQIQ